MSKYVCQKEDSGELFLQYVLNDSSRDNLGAYPLDHFVNINVSVDADDIPGDSFKEKAINFCPIKEILDRLDGTFWVGIPGWLYEVEPLSIPEDYEVASANLDVYKNYEPLMDLATNIGWPYDGIDDLKKPIINYAGGRERHIGTSEYTLFISELRKSHELL